MKCQNCGKDFSGWAWIDGKKRNLHSRKYCLDCSPFGQHRTRPIGEQPSKSYQYVRTFRKRFMERAIAYKGGKCQICGYDRCNRALEFHHVNPEEKLFNISNGIKSWDKAKAELDKCVLLCANCHREVEAGITILA